MEVQQQPQRLIAEFEIGQQLNPMYGRDRFTGLQFEDYGVFNEKVDPVTDFQMDGLVNNRERHLAVDNQTSFSQFVQETGLIGTFEEPRPKCRVNCYGRIDDYSADLI